jgi:hypothetical protein
MEMGWTTIGTHYRQAMRGIPTVATRDGRSPTGQPVPHHCAKEARSYSRSPNLAERELRVSMLLGVRMVPAVRMVRGGVRMRLFAVFVDRLG